jgi:hypothetical protein
MIAKKRGERYDVIDNGKFLGRNVPYAVALAAVKATGVSEIDAHLVLQAEPTWEAYREAWYEAVKNGTPNVQYIANQKNGYFCIIDVSTGRVSSWKVTREQAIRRLRHLGLSEYEANEILDNPPDDFTWRRAYRMACEHAEADKC